MYKDKEKQKEADRERQRRYRESHPISGKRRDKGVTESGCDKQIVTPKSNALHPAILANIRQVCTDENGVVDAAKVKVRTASAQAYARMFPNRPVTIIPTTYEMTDSERKNYKPANELAPGQFNPVSKPGTPEYGDEMKPCSECGKDIRAILTICLSCAEVSEPQTASTTDGRIA